MRYKDGRDGAHNLVLHRKDILDLAVVAFSPPVSCRPRIDELNGDANAVAPSPDAAFQHVAYPELAPDLAHVSWLIFVSEAGVAGDDQ
jgi:hypothetical protein